jgi:hypothetical protein
MCIALPMSNINNIRKNFFHCPQYSKQTLFQTLPASAFRWWFLKHSLCWILVTMKNVPINVADITHIKPLSKIWILQLFFPFLHRKIYISIASLEVFSERWLKTLFLEYDDAAPGNLLLRFQRNSPKCQESWISYSVTHRQSTDNIICYISLVWDR